MAVQRISVIGAEPVTLAEAKLHLRIDTPDDDTLITALIAAAREFAENSTRRAIVKSRFRLGLDRFPRLRPGTRLWDGGCFSASVSYREGLEIHLPMSPCLAVETISYIATDGSSKNLAPSDYKLDAVSEPARIGPAFGKTWPATRAEISAVEVIFTAGYEPGTVPEGIKSWMKLRIGALYENREEIAVGNRVVVAELPFVDRLLDPYRVITF